MAKKWVLAQKLTFMAARDQFCHYKVGGSCFLKWSQIESCEENNFFRDALAKHRLIKPFF